MNQDQSAFVESRSIVCDTIKAVFQLGRQRRVLAAPLKLEIIRPQSFILSVVMDLKSV